MAQIHPLKTKTKLISHPGVRREDPPSAVHLHSEARNGKQIQAILSFESKERRSWVPRGPGSSKCRVLRMGNKGVWEQGPAGAGLHSVWSVASLNAPLPRLFFNCH